MKKIGYLFFLILFFAACKSENENHIVGKWKAAQLMECDNIVPIQTELVDIEFSENGRYVFHSTLNVKEEGTYRVKKNYLFTQDKLREDAPEKAVLIKSIDADSLVLQMSYKGKDQWLKLVKEGALNKPIATEQDDLQAKALPLESNNAVAAASVPSVNTDSLKKVEDIKKEDDEKKKKAEAEKETERKKAEAIADKKREAEADRKREEAKQKTKKQESSSSSSESYKKREAKRKEEERKAKEEAEKKAEKFRKEYAKREAEKKKKR